MSLDDRARSATDELLRTAPPDAVAMLDDLHRRRRRGTAARAAAAVCAVTVAVAGGAAVMDGRPTPPPPATPTQVMNGALISTHLNKTVAIAGTVAELPTDAALGSGVQFTSDGAELVYQARGQRIVAFEVADGDRRHLADCPGAGYCGFALSPDERQLAVLSEDGGGEFALSVVDLQSETSEIIRTVTAFGDPAWSPDGERIAYVDGDGLHVMAPDGSDDRRILDFDSPQVVEYDRPAWSPDGSRLAFITDEQVELTAEVAQRSGVDAVSRFDLRVVDVDTGAVTDLGDLGACYCLGASPPRHAWSPDGRWIAVSTVDSPRVLRDPGSARTGGVYLVAPDSGDRQLLRNAEVGDLAWQPLPDDSERFDPGRSP